MCYSLLISGSNLNLSRDGLQNVGEQTAGCCWYVFDSKLLRCRKRAVLEAMPPTWSQWRDKCYKLHDTYATWEEGKRICVELGGGMVVPQFDEELQHFNNMSSCDYFWIGCNDLVAEGLYKRKYSRNDKDIFLILF